MINLIFSQEDELTQVVTQTPLTITDGNESDQSASQTANTRKGRSKRSSATPRALKTKIGKVPKQSLAKRRNVSLGLNLTPSHPYDDKIPSHSVTPVKARKTSKFTTSAVVTTAANVLYDDEAKANPEVTQGFSCRGKLFMSSAKSADSKARLFFNLGQNLYLDKQMDKTGVGEGSLRLSLWKTNAIDKLQRVGARYSITLNFDAIQQLRKEADDVKMCLSLTDNEEFVGYCLTLGHMTFLTVEPNMCLVNLRKWYKPLDVMHDPEGDLRPSREGVHLSYEQFKRFVEFLDTQLNTEFPTFDNHVFCCDRANHKASSCTMCNVQGLLPIQREFKRLMNEW